MAVNENLKRKRTINMTSDENKLYVPRVTQLDSVELDKEILQVLKSQVLNISKITPGSVLDSLDPEISALLRFCIWKFSVHQAYSTFGQQLLNVKYEGKFTKHKSYAWCFLTIVPSYLKDRYGNNLSSHRNGSGYDVVHKTVKWMHIFVKIAPLSNLLMFLNDGNYPSLIERVLRMRQEPLTKQQRLLGYGYMTRELLWHTLIELLGNMLPLLNYYSLQRKFFSLFSKTQKKSFIKKPVVFHLGDKCAICKESPIQPHHMGCSHIYCFYCIQGNLLANADFECPSCGYSEENPVALPVPYTKTQYEAIL